MNIFFFHFCFRFQFQHFKTRLPSFVSSPILFLCIFAILCARRIYACIAHIATFAVPMFMRECHEILARIFCFIFAAFKPQNFMVTTSNNEPSLGSFAELDSIPLTNYLSGFFWIRHKIQIVRIWFEANFAAWFHSKWLLFFQILWL